ncbi:UPF0173 metal-dependent hydrolase [Fusarium oxysporum f. sp. rapae]|uniref:UPF0173 metal-dependent hydrolase n=1 Tax=Fusarium oxysporum f. sp. rapae TaxID=485398 RepID=A0A8J5NWG6_FUSOX|nr:UPF0173 metal-dependent hydrolase [Fusarium oxysporum f. sp. rapae]
MPSNLKTAALALLASATSLVATSPVPSDNRVYAECGKPNVTFGVTHIITAASVFHINDVNLLTDPFFSPANTTWPTAGGNLTVLADPALQPSQIPVIDAVLLSHESHPDNLDEIGRQHFIDGRKVITTPDGAKNLSPRPGVVGLQNWQTIDVKLDGEIWKVTGTPCNHTTETQTMGFALHGPGFGYTDGLPNAIWYSGDTIYIEELKQLNDMFHIRAAVFNMGDAHITVDGVAIQITMNGTEVAQMFKDVGAEILVPIHYSPWSHFREQSITQLKKDFDEAGVSDKVKWLVPGQKTLVF